MKKIVAFFIFMIIAFSDVQAIFVSPKIEKVYSEKIVTKIEKSSNDIEKRIKILEEFWKKIKKIKNFKKYKNNKNIQNILEQILYLNEKQIKKYKTQLIFKKLKNKELQKDDSNLESQNNNSSRDSEINLEWQEKNIYEEKYKKELEQNKKIIDGYNYTKYFKNKIYSNDLIFLDNWVWYAYFYKNYTYFPDDSTVNLRDLNYNNIDTEKSVIFVVNGKIWIIQNPIKKRLIKDDVIKDLENKYYFLKILKDDIKKTTNKNYDNDFLKLKKISKNITYNLSIENKIRNIYNYVLKSLEYSKNIDFSDYKIFSWIEAFKNKNWVCSAYSKLMIYMLLFNNINDIKYLKWYVLDAQDFPEVWHAWLRIWNKYYDPTFDDPSWAEDDKKFEEYKYFWLPKDLFYTNRYDENKLPEYLKNLSLKERKKIILKRLYDIYPKYKDQNYNLLKNIDFRIKHNISYDEEITLENFSKILPKKVVSNFSFYDDWVKKYILKMKYFPIDTNTDFDALLEQLNYNLDWYYFFEWYDKNWNKSYKLAYDVVVK